MSENDQKSRDNIKEIQDREIACKLLRKLLVEKRLYVIKCLNYMIEINEIEFLLKQLNDPYFYDKTIKRSMCIFVNYYIHINSYPSILTYGELAFARNQNELVKKEIKEYMSNITDHFLNKITDDEVLCLSNKYEIIIREANNNYNKKLFDKIKLAEKEKYYAFRLNANNTVLNDEKCQYREIEQYTNEMLGRRNAHAEMEPRLNNIMLSFELIEKWSV